jgi:hypothetical protein
MVEKFTDWMREAGRQARKILKRKWDRFCVAHGIVHECTSKMASRTFESCHASSGQKQLT